MTYEATNLSNAEYYRLNGTLSPERIEELLDQPEYELHDISGDHTSGLFAEDELVDFINDLHALTKRLRGDNKEFVQNLITRMDDYQLQRFNEADYNRSELHGCKLVKE